MLLNNNFMATLFLIFRAHGQVPSCCWMDVRWMDTALFAILPDGQGSVLSPLFSSTHVQLHAIWLAVTYACPLLHEI